MKYVTPDVEIKKVFQELESNVLINTFYIRNTNLYSICRFYLEMQYRNTYFYKYNKTELPTFHYSDRKKVKTYNSLLKLIHRIKSKLQYLQTRHQTSKYYKQFNDPSKINRHVDLLFVATSAFKNKHNQSLELFDLIKHCKNANETVAFAIPNYDTSIKRRKEYDYFFSLDHSSKIDFTDQEKKTCESFRNFIKENLILLSDAALDGIAPQIYSALSKGNDLKNLLQILKPKIVVARSLYSDKWLIIGCQASNVKCLEVQHGVFTYNNFYYHPLANLDSKTLLLPDLIACLGREWLSILQQQSSQWNISNSGTIGSPIKISRKNINKKTNVLIAFQDFDYDILDIRTDILIFFKKFSAKLKDFDFTLRFHPANENASKTIFPDLPFIHFSYPKTESITQALEKTDLLISATSMVIYEALTFNIPVISFERFRKMSCEKGITFVNNEEELFDVITNKKHFQSESPEYLSPSDFTFFDRVAFQK